MKASKTVVNKKTNIHKCKNCGALMRYDISSKMLFCEHCSSKEEMETKPNQQLDFAEAHAKVNAWDDAVQNFKCANCGAVSVIEKQQLSPKCPFCGTSNLIKKEEMVGTKPNAILPFLIDASVAVLNYKKWLHKQVLAPTKIRKFATLSNLNGMYIPCWTFSFNYSTSYSGKLAKTYVVTVGSGKNARVETRTRYFNISGNESGRQENSVYEASSNITETQLHKIGGFDVANAYDYDDAFMAGYASERYKEDIDQVWEKAKNDSEKMIRAKILKRYDYTSVVSLEMTVSYGEKKYNYLLAPIWISQFKHRNKNYGIIENGRTGRVVGKTPISPIKIAFIGLVVAGIIGAIWLILKFTGST